jgi:hypothetical protein
VQHRLGTLVGSFTDRQYEIGTHDDALDGIMYAVFGAAFAWPKGTRTPLFLEVEAHPALIKGHLHGIAAPS